MVNANIISSQTFNHPDTYIYKCFLIMGRRRSITGAWDNEGRKGRRRDCEILQCQLTHVLTVWWYTEGLLRHLLAMVSVGIGDIAHINVLRTGVKKLSPPLDWVIRKPIKCNGQQAALQCSGLSVVWWFLLFEMFIASRLTLAVCH